MIGVNSQHQLPTPKGGSMLGVGSWELGSPSESKMHRETRRPPAKVDPVGEHSDLGVDVSFRVLIADLSAHHPHIRHGRADAAEDDRPDAVALRDVAVAEDQIIDVDELAGLAVAPVEESDAAANVWLNAAAAERQESNSGGQWHDAQLELLLDLSTVRVRQAPIAARHATL